MYQPTDNERGSRRLPDGLPPVTPEVHARHAAARVRQALLDATVVRSRSERTAARGASGLLSDRASLLSILSIPLVEPRQEAERRLAVGWLHWLGGEYESAESLLAGAEELLPAGSEERAEAGYWLARVRLLLGRIGAAEAFEQVLRALKGSPRATCWFVDLLWRGGYLTRAEQVWKSVRLNRRVTDCDETPLLEARYQLKQGDTAAAEKALRESQPRGGVCQAERLLLLAWVLTARREFDEAADLLRQADPFPTRAPRAWQALYQAKTAAAEQSGLSGDPFDALLPLLSAPPLRAWVEGQHARAAGAVPATVLPSLESATASVPLRPFMRYALACLGRDDFADLLSELPGSFLAPRCRLWLTLSRFCRREVSARELRAALQQAAATGHGVANLDAWIEWAKRLDEELRPDSLWPAPGTHTGQANVLARNERRAAVEEAARRLPPADALARLNEWAADEHFRADEQLCQYAGRQMLRLLLAGRGKDAAPTTSEVLKTAGQLLGSPALPWLVGRVLDHGRAEGEATLVERPPGDGPNLVRLWQTAEDLALPRAEPDAAAWTDAVKRLCEDDALAPLALSLLVVGTARHGDGPSVLDLLDPSPRWELMAAGPPAFVVRAVRGANRPDLLPGRWRQTVARWLRCWDPAALGPEARALAVEAGILPYEADTAEPPAGAEPVEWFLHQASQALGREDAVAALVWVRRALARGTDHLPANRANIVRDALPELERLAGAQLLAAVARLDPTQPQAPAALFTDLLDLLAEDDDGRSLLAAAGSGNLPGARERLAGLSQRPGLPSRLAHHLALIYLRAARHFEGRDRTDEAEPYWRMSWRCWLRLSAIGYRLSAKNREEDAGGEGPKAESRKPIADSLIDHLLAGHREQLKGLLGRNEVARARCYWNLVMHLPQLAPPGAETLNQVLRRRLEQFRDDLATDYLLATREAMRGGAIPEGWRADYEKGLTWLRRLLSLDRDNLRLLTALAETCADWFLDLYNTRDAARLRAEVERYTPFALQLRLAAIGHRPSAKTREAGELAARAALGEFFKFRGFVAEEPWRKAALYREALELDPANENVRDLLAEMEGA